jgi:pimeloyl-ACP methyl ester carboxylesterase
MPSSRFENIFDGAATIVESRCRGMVGVRTVLDDIKRRGQSPIKDPLQNRELIVEPWIDSQRLRVPVGAVESVAAELQKLNVLHIWVRVHCPSVDTDEEDDVIIETNNSKQFKQAFQEVCPQCGQFHETIAVEDIERFYAIHFDDEQDPFSIGRFVLKKSPKVGPGSGSHDNSGKKEQPPNDSVAGAPAERPRRTPTPLKRVLLKFQSEGREAPISPAIREVGIALDTNQRTTTVPTVNEVVTSFWRRSLLSVVIVMIISVVLYFVNATNIIVFWLAAYFLVYGLCCNYILKAFFPSDYVPMRIAAFLFCLAAGVLATSILDVEVGIGQNVPSHLPHISQRVRIPNVIGAFAIAALGAADVYYLRWSNAQPISRGPKSPVADELLPICGSRDPQRVGDVVFVHGLNGNPRHYWCHEGNPENLWPAWLGEDLPEVGVWSLGYENAAFKARKLSLLRRFSFRGFAMPLTDRAKNVLLLFELAGLGKRPLVFITHSMGGLLVKQLLHTASDSTNPQWRAILEQTRGVCFIATPHIGSDLAKWASYFRTLLGTNVSMDELRPHEPLLRDLKEWYSNFVARDQVNIKTVSFYEMKPLPGIGFVVEPGDADPNVPNAGLYPLGENHGSICTPKSKDDIIHKKVCAFIGEDCFRT